MRTRDRLLIAIVLLVAVGLVVLRGMPPGGQDIATAAVFEAAFPDSEGQMQALSQWRNKTVVLNFWASWCPPCRDEMPELSALQDKYRGSGLVVVGLSTDDADKLREFSASNSVSYPLLAGDFEAMRLATTLGNDREVLPYTVVIRPDGKIAASHFGRLDMVALEQVLPPLPMAPR